MRKLAVLLLALALALLPAAGATGAAGAADAVGADAAKAAWRGYTVVAAWVTADKEEIGNPAREANGLAVLVRLTPEEGKFAFDDVQNNREDFRLVDADGDEWPATHCVYHNVKIDPVTMTPSIDPEQDDVELVFILEGKDEAALNGAQLALAGAEPERIGLDGVTREKPEAE